MAFVFLENNTNIRQQLSSHYWNTTDTYFMTFGDRGDSFGKTQQLHNLQELAKKWQVTVLLHAISANNYYVHIGDFDDDDVAEGMGLPLNTIVFELSPGQGMVFLNDQTNVQPVPQMPL